MCMKQWICQSDKEENRRKAETEDGNTYLDVTCHFT